MTRYGVCGWLVGWVVLGLAGCGSPEAQTPVTVPAEESRGSEKPSTAASDAEKPETVLAPAETPSATEPASTADSLTRDSLPVAPPVSSAPSSNARAIATAKQAAEVIDLREFPLAPEAETATYRVLSSQNYQTAGPPEKTFTWLREQLTQAGWKELPGSYTSEQGGSGTFQKEGFTLSASVFGSGAGSTVSIFNHGNVDLAKLPLPAGATPLYAGPVSASFTTEASLTETAAATGALLEKEGWEPYGGAGDVSDFVQNGVKLSARVYSAPAQGGKTMLEYSARILPVEIPLLPGAEQVQYSDIPTQLAFDVTGTIAENAPRYRETLAAHGWKPTTENPVQVDWKQFLIFRDEADDLLDVQLTEVDGKTRALVRYQTAAEVAAETDRAKAAAQRRLEMANRPKPTLTLPLPPEARTPQWTATGVEFTTAVGQAQGVIQAIRDKLVADGWQEGNSMLEENFGTMSLRKEGQSLLIGYIESGILPGEVTISATGVELKPPGS